MLCHSTLKKPSFKSQLKADISVVMYYKYFKSTSIFYFKYSCGFNNCSDIYLDGNHLECEGVIEMIKLLADKAEMEAIERAEKKEVSNANPVSKPMSAVSHMSATNATFNDETLPEGANDSR